MLIGRFLMKIPVLAIAGSLARKKSVPPSLGTFPVTTPLFTVLLIGVILIVGALTFFPALSLGPILEHLLHDGRQDVLRFCMATNLKDKPTCRVVRTTGAKAGPNRAGRKPGPRQSGNGRSCAARSGIPF